MRFQQQSEQAGSSEDSELPLRFEHLSVEQGLSSPFLRAILQDSRGFLWFGTVDGLNRYDGYQFKIYKHDFDDPFSLGANFIQALYEDPSGILWIGTEGGGLNRFDPQAERFTRYKNNPDDPASLSHNTVSVIVPGSNGDLWIGTPAGLNRFDPQTGKFMRYPHNSDDPSGQGYGEVSGIAEDRDGLLWIGAYGAGLYRFDPRTGQYTHYHHDPSDPGSLGSDLVQTIYLDRQGELWVGTWDAGLDWLDPQSGDFIHYLPNGSGPQSLSSEKIWKIFEDREGALWIGTWGGGLERFDRDEKRFIRYQHDPQDPASMSHPNVVDIYEDRDGSLWVGTAGGGVDVVHHKRQPFENIQNDPDNPNSLSFNDVRAITQDRTGIVWIGTAGGGLNRWDRRTGQFTRYRHDPADPQSLADDQVWSLLEDRQGVLWVGTFKGLDRFDRGSGKFFHYPHDPNDPGSLSENTVYRLMEDRDGVLWVGTWGGLNRFNPGTGTFTRFQHDPENPDSLCAAPITGLMQDRSGALWIGCYEEGLDRLDLRTHRVTHYPQDPNSSNTLTSLQLWTLYQDESGALWIGASGGLNRFDPQTGMFRHYTMKDGLPSDMVAQIMPDDTGFLWLSTTNGLSRFDPARSSFRNYDVKDGLPGDTFSPFAGYRNDQGELFFGGTDGLTVFNPAELKDNPAVPPIWITDFRLDGQPVPVGDDSALKQSILYTDDLVLGPGNQVATFGFSALSYIAPEKNRYRFMLEGFDADWRSTDSSRRYTTYTNLDPGQYVFRVQGSNNDGVWNAEGASIHIRVLGPWWETLWFRGLAVFLAAGLVSAGVYGRSRVHEAQRARLQAEVEKRTQELQSEITERRQFEQALRISNSRLTGMLEISRTIVSTLEPERLLDLILEQLAGVVPYDGAAVLTLEGDVLVMQADRVPFPLPEISSIRISINQLQGVERLLEIGPVFYVPDIQEHPLITQAVSRATGQPETAVLKYPTWLVVQLLFQDELIGFLVMFHETADYYTVSDRELAQAFANQAATALQNSRLHQRAQVEAVVDERSRLARELHDSVTQALYGMILYHDASTLALSAGKVETGMENLHEMRNLALEAMADLRLLIFELRPSVLEHEGLVAAIQARIEAVEVRSGFKAQFDNLGYHQLTPEMEAELYRIVQEGFNNIHKHAQAKHVRLTLTTEDGLVLLTLEDDGVGFSVEDAKRSGGFGLSGMQERAVGLGGSLDLQSTPGQGTLIKVKVPSHKIE